MWYGLPQYLLFAGFVSLIWHLVSNQYVQSTIGSAAVSSAVNMAHILLAGILAGKHINLGFIGLPFSIGIALAIPVCAVVGLPFLVVRGAWKTAK
ncbi:MAG: hypothetical protein JWN70_2893 [Planctomycetaceae bacterium]|nr:hypothetical protein [Planctomycetaceae bacterium]